MISGVDVFGLGGLVGRCSLGTPGTMEPIPRSAVLVPVSSGLVGLNLQSITSVVVGLNFRPISTGLVDVFEPISTTSVLPDRQPFTAPLIL